MASSVNGAIASGRSDTGTRPRVTVTDALLFTMSVIWGVNFSVVKYGTSVLHPLAYNAVRITMATAALLAVAAVVSGERLRRREVLALIALGALGNGLYQIFFVEGLARTLAGNAALVLAAGPAFIALTGRLMGVERVGRRGIAGIALSIAGIAMVVLGTGRVEGGESTLLGDVLVLCGSLCWSVYAVLLQPYTSRIGALRVSALTMLGGALLVVLVSGPALTATDWMIVPAGVWGAVVYSGLGALVVAYLFWYQGVRVLGPTRTAMYSNLQPVIGLLVAWIWLHEVPTVWQGVGAATVITGVVLTRT